MTPAEMVKELERLGKRAEREHRARQEAELLAEQGIRQLYERQRELALINVITDAANGTTSVHAAIQVTLDEICAYTGWPLGHAYYVGDDPSLLHSAKIWHIGESERFATFRQITEATALRRGVGLPGRVLESCIPAWVSDVKLDANFPRNKHSLELGVRAAFAFPVLAGPTVVAVLEFFSWEVIKAEDGWLKIAAQAGIQLGRVFERQRAASELESMHAELLQLSRRAGMAEVATDVLHNVGNVLNSVGISASLVGERLKRSKVGNLNLATKMLREQGDHLGDFLTTDPKGRGLAEYLDRAAEQLVKEQTELVAESALIADNVEHIKVIVSMQQRYAKASSMVEKVPAFDIVQDALRMTVAAFTRHGIQVIREFDDTALEMCVDRHKVLQILINLISNAKEAMDQDGVHDKQMIIRMTPHCSSRVRISVSDNGTGIASRDLEDIFNHGFTTKREGHGFGLHSAANAAKEMGGSLSAYSDGEGKGATFVLELPLGNAGEALSATA